MIKRSKKRAFTLIELIIVIAIIAALTAVVVVSLNIERTKSRNARRMADLKLIQSAVEIYANNNGVYYEYPDSLSDEPSATDGCFSGSTTDTCWSDALATALSSQLATLPVPPASPEYESAGQIKSCSSTAGTSTAAAKPNNYRYVANSENYKLRAHLEAEGTSCNAAAGNDGNLNTAFELFSAGAKNWNSD